MIDLNKLLEDFKRTIDNLTPEAKQLGKSLIKENAKEFIITDEVLQETYDNYRLDISFPAEYNGSDFTELVDFIDIEIRSWQSVGD